MTEFNTIINDRINNGVITQSHHAINIIYSINPSIYISPSLISRLTKLVRRVKDRSPEKLPLLIIKKGIKENCQSVNELKEIADDHNSELILTRKGWINEESFLYYLECIFKPNVNTPCALII